MRFYARGALLLVGPERIARAVLKGSNLNICSVVFDGRYVWAAAGYDRGVYVIDREGKTVAHVSGADGLPDAYATMPLHPLEPGRVMAAGSIGQNGRGWLAVIDPMETKPRVNVFHEAVKVGKLKETFS